MKATIECVFGNTIPEGATSTDSAVDYGCDACEYIKDNVLRRCCKFICIAGRTPDGKDVNTWKCSEAWLPLLMVENAMTNRGQTAAIESLRNESIKRQDALFDAVTGQFLLP